MTLQDCCGCCSLKTGVLIIAILTLINASLSLIGMVVQLAMPSVENATVTVETVDLLRIHHSASNIYAYMIGPVIVYFAIALCFIYGVTKEKKYFILPILIVDVLEIVLASIYVIILAVAVHPALLLLFAVVALGLYLWYVILSFYKLLSERDTAAQYSTVEMGGNNLVQKV